MKCPKDCDCVAVSIGKAAERSDVCECAATEQREDPNSLNTMGYYILGICIVGCLGFMLWLYETVSHLKVWLGP